MGITAKLLVRFALSYDITLAIVGCSTPDEVQELADAGRDFTKLTLDEKKEIAKPFIPMSDRLAFYRGSIFKKP